MFIRQILTKEKNVSRNGNRFFMTFFQNLWSDINKNVIPNK